jgi:hypothetical protein
MMMSRWQRRLGWLSIVFGTLAAVSVALWLYAAVFDGDDAAPVSVLAMLVRVCLAVVLLWQGWRFLNLKLAISSN